MQAGRFPRPINIGVRAVGWIEEEVDAELERRREERNRILAERARKRARVAHVLPEQSDLEDFTGRSE
jgi:hypothetical protein